MKMIRAIPALPVSDVARAVEYYTGRFGFESRYADDDYGIVGKDEVEIHLWPANKPNTPGAEPHLAGSASCRIQVSDVEALYGELDRAGIVHPNGALDDHPWGREFTTLDADRNAITFFQP
ncbi:hypothetical protein C1I95_06715 [Micromonospora craterilacus]|uniref:Bleomycin resistance protein n=1 Tax=Micromonospora craterilacus TaxID=1655439 RepID=A0A2W2FJA0_9ACTN|nr:VOC family protein [Micromonospora craterilacus]PZG21827.1 hypothetical protein C1I95_06715 [Micromonospora craterilacus]